MSNICGICGSNGDHTGYSVRDMMFGNREEFRYFLCADCGCLQLAAIPADLSKYYPPGYYSFSEKASSRKGLSRWLYGSWIRYLVTKTSLAGRIMARLKRKKIPVFELYRAAGMRTGQKILDVGSGSGSTLWPLTEAGFDHLTGSDEFIEKDIRYDNGLLVRKANLFDIRETDWDLIMFNHSFEHLPRQQAHLEQVHRLLKPGGTCLIRIPTVSSYAWNHYRENWVQLDAPRHFFLHSHKSITLLAERSGFRVKEIIQESDAFQFTGSEQYLRDIPMHGDPASYFEGNTSLFSSGELMNFAARAEQLNQRNLGDSIGVIMIRE
jgi:SAM-dependent methyltransferase